MDRIPAQSFQESIVWQKAHQFVLAVYHYSDYFPQKEMHGLTSQFRQAAISIAREIAEGLNDKRGPEKASYMNEARDSLEECRYYLVLAKDLGYGDNPELLPQLEEVSRLLEEYITDDSNS